MSLYLCALAYGLASAMQFRHLADWTDIRATVDRMIAHVLEIALFSDEPVLVWRAQGRIWLENWKLLRRLAVPVIGSAVLFALVAAAGGDSFSRGPLRRGETAVVSDAGIRDGLLAETGPIRIARTGETLVRVRAARDIPLASQEPRPWVGRFLLISLAPGLLLALSGLRR